MALRLSFFLCCWLLIIPLSSAAELQLHAVNPAVVPTGANVQILGSGFSAATQVLLGGQELKPQLISEGQLQLLIPQLPEGSYALQLTDGVVTAAQSLSLYIELPAPRITDINPTNVNECSNPEERLVTVSGGDFQPGANLLMNGSAVPASIDSSQSISFVAPQLDAGIYGLQVVNPNGKRSLPHSLYFNNIPKIFSLSEGEDYVGSYQLIIEGKNFYPHSSLVVREYPSGFGDLPPQQRIIHGRDVMQGSAGARLRGHGDYLNYVNCNTLIYYRYPYSGQDKELSLQIVNRDGKSSQVEYITTR
ncbi:IPT/TIG domain-containing protein [Malonomonas rubra]|uniref:IPT/TIG domain-containing protein n=1 Tax=Malonomonas rubra TaxID=57040 RepID=UPI0026F173A4|nr:IPT/TIG domain-containing protein [Malonomonas rubra]